MENNLGPVKKGMTFRSQLTIYGIILVLLVGLPFMVIGIKAPWDVLNKMIKEGHCVLAGLKAGFQDEELQRMNAFALRMAKETDPENEDYLVWSFNLLIEDRLPTEEEITAEFAENEVEVEEFDYQRFLAADTFWQSEFENEPGLLELFRKYKNQILASKQLVQDSGFEMEDAYVMVDDGQIFAFVLDGYPWYESIYPGLQYDVTEHGDEYWRSYLTEGPGFYANPKYYHFHLFPKFDTDQWGAWFTIWTAIPQGDDYNAFSIDFEASEVKRKMWQVGGIVIGAIIAILAIIIFVSTRLSRLITVPITHIVKGTEAVMREDFDHVVPQTGGRDFILPIQVFNQMIQRVKEMRELEISYEDLKKLDQIKDNFLSMVSHDLRTPMTSIKGYSSILWEQTGQLDEKTQKEYLNIIIEESDRLIRLINDLLDLKKIEAGRMKLNLAPFAVNEFLNKSLASFRGAALAKELEISLKPLPNDEEVIADQDRMSQVMANLLSNAIKFTPPPGKVEINAETILNHGRKEFKITVTDTGPGIPLDQQAKLFDKFQHADGLVRSKDQGSGLGLAFAREIVESHGGRIGFSSKPGQGSSFFFIIRTDVT